jgi:predicted DNA-binding transcriptional regulator AlpA
MNHSFPAAPSSTISTLSPLDAPTPVSIGGMTGYLRLREVLKLYPVSRSCWLAGVKSGRYPRGYKLSERCTAWLASDIAALIQNGRPA